MKHVWSVLCRNYIVDEQTKNLSLIDIPNRLDFKGQLPDSRPIEIPLKVDYYFISTWMRESDAEQSKQDISVRVKEPNGNIAGHFGFEVDLEGAYGHRTFGKLDKVLYTVNGVYELQICVREADTWTPVAFIPLEIVHEQTKPEQQKSEPAE